MSFHPAAMYSPDRILFVCTTAEQHAALAARGWKSLPADLGDPYKPDEARWVPNYAEIPADVPAAAIGGPEVIDKPARKAGRPKKV